MYVSQARVHMNRSGCEGRGGGRDGSIEYGREGGTGDVHELNVNNSSGRNEGQQGGQRQGQGHGFRHGKIRVAGMSPNLAVVLITEGSRD